jgi:hypothetical protein
MLKTEELSYQCLNQFGDRFLIEGLEVTADEILLVRKKFKISLKVLGQLKKNEGGYLLAFKTNTTVTNFLIGETQFKLWEVLQITEEISKVLQKEKLLL